MATITISSYKLNLLQDIFNNPAIVQGIDSQQNGVDVDDPSSLIYKNLWPAFKVKELQRVADSLILVEVDEQII